MVTTERLGTVAGVLAPAVALGAIVVAAVVSPTFSWTGNALSDLGVRAETAALFNGGLIIAGALTLPFAIRLGQVGRNAGERAGAAVLGLTGVALAGVGAFPASTAAHLPATAGFYLLLTLSLWVYAAGNALAGDHLLSVATVTLGLLNVAGWVVWALSLRAVAPGLALPELAGAVVLAVWAVGTAVRVSRHGRGRRASAAGV